MSDVHLVREAVDLSPPAWPLYGEPTPRFLRVEGSLASYVNSVLAIGGWAVQLDSEGRVVPPFHHRSFQRFRELSGNRLSVQEIGALSYLMDEYGVIERGEDGSLKMEAVGWRFGRYAWAPKR